MTGVLGPIRIAVAELSSLSFPEAEMELLLLEIEPYRPIPIFCDHLCMFPRQLLSMPWIQQISLMFLPDPCLTSAR